MYYNQICNSNLSTFRIRPAIVFLELGMCSIVIKCYKVLHSVTVINKWFIYVNAFN